MFSVNEQLDYNGQTVTVVRAEPDSDGDIIVRGIDGFTRYVREKDCQPKRTGAPVAPTVPAVAPAAVVEHTISETQPTETVETPKGNDTMSSVSRTVVSVALLDQDAGLKPELALVADLGEHVVENGNTDSLKQKLLMDPKMGIAAKLEAHNEVRGKQTDLDILKRTGNKVKLQPVEIHELTWSIK